MLKSTSNVQICPKKVISPIFWGWDWDHQSYSGEESGFLGVISNYSNIRKCEKSSTIDTLHFVYKEAVA